MKVFSKTIRTIIKDANGNLIAVGTLASDTQSTSNYAITTGAYPYGYNGTTWDRLRTQSADYSARTPTGTQQVMSTVMQASGNVAALKAAQGYTDTDAGNNTPVVALARFNGTTWDRCRNNIEGTLLASAARTVTTNSALQVNYNGQGVTLLLNVTAKAAATTLNVKLQALNAITGSYTTLSESGALAAAAGTTHAIIFHPDVLDADYDAAHVAKAVALPRSWRIEVTPSDANSVTYSVDYHTHTD